MNRLAIATLAVASMSLTACPKQDDSNEPLTQTEARLAVDESAASNQASDLTATSIEISTNFTIGGAVTRAAEELKTFIGSQLACAEITLVTNKLSIKYGAKPGNC